MESGRQRYEQVLRNILEHHWDEKALLMETERIETLVKPHLVHQTKAEITQIVQEEARGWIEWLRKNPAEAREEALNSRDFRRLPTEAQEIIMEAMQQIEERYFGRAKFMTPVKFESNNCSPGELANVQITSANKNSLFGIHKNHKSKAAQLS